jgi:hypothetical protein
MRNGSSSKVWDPMRRALLLTRRYRMGRVCTAMNLVDVADLFAGLPDPVNAVTCVHDRAPSTLDRH